MWRPENRYSANTLTARSVLSNSEPTLAALQRYSCACSVRRAIRKRRTSSRSLPICRNLKEEYLGWWIRLHDFRSPIRVGPSSIHRPLQLTAGRKDIAPARPAQICRNAAIFERSERLPRSRFALFYSSVERE